MKCQHNLDYEVCLVCWEQAMMRARKECTLEQAMVEREALLLQISKMLQELRDQLVTA